MSNKPVYVCARDTKGVLRVLEASSLEVALHVVNNQRQGRNAFEEELYMSHKENTSIKLPVMVLIKGGKK